MLGEPGIGKRGSRGPSSRNSGNARGCLTGRCVPYGEGTTYLPLAEVVRAAVGPGDLRATSHAGSGDAGRGARRRAARGVVTGDAAAVPSSEIFWAVRRFLEALARDRPRLVVLDDVHWAEPTLLDLVEYVAGWSEAPSPCLRWREPNCSRPGPPGPGGRRPSGSRSDARALLDALPGRSRVGADAVAAVLESADGNPLFLEQVAALAAERPLAPGSCPRPRGGAREPARPPPRPSVTSSSEQPWSDGSSHTMRWTPFPPPGRSPPWARA